MSHNASAARGSREHSADAARKINYFLQIRNCFIINALNALTLHEIKSLRIEYMWILNMQSVCFQVMKIVTLSTRFYHQLYMGQGWIYRHTAGITFLSFKECVTKYVEAAQSSQLAALLIRVPTALPPCSRWYDMISCFNYWVASQYNFLFWIEIGKKCSEYERAHPDLPLLGFSAIFIRSSIDKSAGL